MALGKKTTPGLRLPGLESLSIEWFWPRVKWQKLAQLSRFVAAQHDLRLDVRGVNLVDEFPAPSARRQHVEKTRIIVSPYCNDPLDAVLAGGHHCGDRRVFGAEAGSRPCVDADAGVEVASIRCQR